jgi:hypothetical protein
MSNVIVVSEEFLKRIFVGLGEMPAKFSHAVIIDIEAQLKTAEEAPHKLLALIEQHLAPVKAKVAADAAKVEAIPAAAVADVKADIKSEEAKVEAVGTAVEKAL